MNQKRQAFILLLLSFAPLVAFYGVEHFYGLKSAIAATIVVTVIEIIYRKIRKEALGAFFYFIALTTIVFGLIDVFSEHTQVFKYEPAITNFVTGAYFIWGAIAPKPLILEFAEKAGKLPAVVSPEMVLYFRVMTWIWVVYFLLKAGVYFAIADIPETTMGTMMIIRTLAGNASMIILLLVSWVAGKPIYRWCQRRVLKTKTGTIPESV